MGTNFDAIKLLKKNKNFKSKDHAIWFIRSACYNSYMKMCMRTVNIELVLVLRTIL